jgi:hypothetical protein
MDSTDINKLLQQYLLLGSGSDNGPSSLVECMAGGTLDIAKYLQYSGKESELDEMRLKLTMELMKKASESTRGVKVKVIQHRAKRKYKALLPYYFDDNGTKVTMCPRQTCWYLMYIKNPALDSNKFKKKFRRRFRMSHDQFERLMGRVRVDETFKRWHPSARNAYRTSPIELLVLGALRYLGRGLTFDDLEEYTAINEETH